MTWDPLRWHHCCYWYLAELISVSEPRTEGWCWIASNGIWLQASFKWFCCCCYSRFMTALEAKRDGFYQGIVVAGSTKMQFSSTEKGLEVSIWGAWTLLKISNMTAWWLWKGSLVTKVEAGSANVDVGVETESPRRGCWVLHPALGATWVGAEVVWEEIWVAGVFDSKAFWDPRTEFVLRLTWMEGAWLKIPSLF